MAVGCPFTVVTGTVKSTTTSGEAEAQSLASLGLYSEGDSISASRPKSSDNHAAELPPDTQPRGNKQGL